MSERELLREKEIISKWSAEMYDREETDTEDVDCLLHLIGTSPMRILEAACGSGRILTALARAGHDVTGLDVDAEMLERIAEKAAGLSHIAWRQADMLTADWGEEYDAVILAGNLLLNIVTDMDYVKAQRLLIQKARQALVPGGLLYLDFNYTQHPEKWYAGVPDFTVFEGTDSDGTTGRVQINHSSFEDDWIRCVRRYELTTSWGKKILWEEPSKKHFIRIEQMRQWLAQEDFAIEKEYGSYHLEPIGEDTNRAVILARKDRMMQ